MSSDKVKTLVEQVAAEADATAEVPMPAGAVGVRPNKSVPVAVRLAPQEVAAIEALAARLDVPMSALLRGWIQAALAAGDTQTVTAALDRLATDLQRLRELVA
jgi:hypothetical protein